MVAVITEVRPAEHRVGRRRYKQSYPHAPCCYQTGWGTWFAEVRVRGERYRLGHRATHDEAAALVAAFQAAAGGLRGDDRAADAGDQPKAAELARDGQRLAVTPCEFSQNIT